MAVVKHTGRVAGKAAASPETEAVCVIGVFDGMHIGHRYLLGQALADAREVGLPCFIVSFDHDPDELLKPPDQVRNLLSDSERLKLLADSGADQLLVLGFDAQLAALAPVDFLNQVLAGLFKPRRIHVGADFRFGAKAQGDLACLQEWAAGHAAQVFGHSLLDDGGQPVSASRIRDCLSAGRLSEANRLLGRPHHLHGRVVPGRGMGVSLGFPTANIVNDDGVMWPADGTYAGLAQLAGDIGLAADNQSQTCLAAAIAVGLPSTFPDAPVSLEAFILNYQGDLYGEELTLSFLEFLRPMQTFTDAQALVDQISRDVARTQQLASAYLDSR